MGLLPPYYVGLVVGLVYCGQWPWLAVGSGLGLPWAMGLALLPFFFSFSFFGFFFCLKVEQINFFF